MIAYNRCGVGRWTRATALAAAVALAVSACGDDDDGTAATPAPGTAPTSAPDGSDGSDAPDAATSPSSAAFDPDATLVYAQGNDLSRMDPHRGLGGPDGVMLFPAYDRLVHVLPNGEFVPGLAESWEFSDDGRTLTLQIREGVTFHDGAQLDAEAVKLSLDRAREGTETDVARDLAPIQDVRVVDPSTVEITLDGPNAAIIGILSDRAGIVISPEAIRSGVDLDATMVGAGPFELVEYVSGAGATYRRFDDYWGEPAKVARLEIRILPDPTSRLNAVRSGDVDVAPIAASDVAAAEQAGLQVAKKTTVSYMNIYQNRSHPALADLRVRQAIVHALDRASMCEAILAGLCQLTDQPFPPGYFANDDAGEQVIYPFDPDRARGLLEEAGVRDLSLSMIVAAGQADAQAIGESVQAQLGEVGISVDLVPVPPNDMAREMFVEQSSPALVSVWSGRPDPSTTLAQRALATGFANPGGGTTEEATALIEESITTLDPDERQRVLQAASRQVAEDLLEVVLMFPEQAFATGPAVVFEPYVTAKTEFRDVAVGG